MKASIFGQREDFSIFVVLPIVLVIFLFLDNSAAELLGIFLVALDQLHIYFTFARKGFISETKLYKYRIYALTGTAALLAYWLFSMKGVGGIFVLVKYMTIFHFCRQQFGWLKIINRKMEVDSVSSKISESMIHVYCLVPIILGHSEKYFFSWYRGVPNIFKISNFFADNLLSVYSVALGIYVFYELYIHLVKKISVNLTRISIIIFTIYSWNYILSAHSEHAYSRLFLLAGHHVISYIYLVGFYNMKSKSEAKLKFFGKSLAAIGIFVLVIAFRNSIEGLAPQSLPWLHISLTPTAYAVFYYFIPLLWFLPLFHFILDGFIWRKRL